MRTRTIFCLAAFMGAANTGCGKASEVAAAVQDAFTDAVSDAKNFVEGTDDVSVRKSKCAREGGDFVALLQVSACNGSTATLTRDGADAEQQPCQDGKGGTYENVCAHRDDGGLTYFNDGPSVPGWLITAGARISASLHYDRWRLLFWVGGLNHDYCYHHNPITHGLSRDTCDKQMLSDVTAICDNEAITQDLAWFNRQTCRENAALAYAAVLAGGADSFEAVNTRVNYPQWSPLWVEFGLPDDPVDTSIVALATQILGDGDTDEKAP